MIKVLSSLSGRSRSKDLKNSPVCSTLQGSLTWFVSKDLLRYDKTRYTTVAGGSGKPNVVITIRNSRGEISEFDIPNVRLVEILVILIKPQDLYEVFGFKIHMYSMKLLDENSRVIADIKDDSSKIPYIARMKPLLGTSAETEESGKCYVTMAIWPKRFGHQNIGYIEKMEKQESVRDLKCSDDDFKYCETCEVVKSKRLPAVRKEDIKAREFGQVISIDIDVIPCESVEGYNYRLNAIDHGSSWL
jgi:hypothetical protein